MSKSIIDYLKEVPDPRGAQGSRDDLWQILLIIIMGIMSGYKGYRGLDRFVERHRRTLIKLLALKQGTVPSYSTLRRMMIDVDYAKGVAHLKEEQVKSKERETPMKSNEMSKMWINTYS